MTRAPVLTPTRLAWLRYLYVHGETTWQKMPRQKISNPARVVTNLTWRPMVEAGWITSEYKQRHWREQHDTYFSITPTGRAVVELDASLAGFKS